MDANLRGSRPRRDRSDSIQRAGTAPPDVAEPQYKETVPLNINAFEFVPSFTPSLNPSWNLNAMEFTVSSPVLATEFVPTAPPKEPPVQFNYSLSASSFEPGKNFEASEFVLTPSTYNNKGKWSTGPPSLGGNAKSEVQTTTKGNEEAKDSKESASPDTQNNPEASSQNLPSEGTEQKAETSNDLTPEHPVSSSEPSSISNDSASISTQVPENNSSPRVYTIEQIMAVAQEEESQIQIESILRYSTRQVEYEAFKPAGYFRHDRKRGPRHHADKKKTQIEPKPLTEEQKDPEKWRFISEKQAEIAQKAKENTQKIQAEVSAREKAQKQIKITLNKLTPSNFNKLKEELLSLSIQDTENLTYLVQTIFQKAVTEIKYTPTYALLCKFLLEGYHKYQFQTDGYESKQRKNNLFRRALLQLCQNLFEFNPQEENFDNLSPEDAQIKRDKLKKKILGNVRLIGELYKLDMILNKIALRCIEDLIHPKIKDEQELDVSACHFNEEKLEGAITLLMTGGKSFEKNSVVRDTDKVFRVLAQISEANIVSPRIKFLILNAIDARKSDWVNENADLPKLVS